jgi:tRNA uridine 5-carboxymethylaminomethyl modification enzyme
MGIGHEIGLISNDKYGELLNKEQAINSEIKRLESTNIGASATVQAFLEKNGSTPLKTGTTLAELVRRPELGYVMLTDIDINRPSLQDDVMEQVDINIKYEGYIRRQKQQVAQYKKLENKKLQVDFDYTEVKGLRREAIQKLNLYKPMSIGQASRISGVSPADISVLLVYLEQMRFHKNSN